MRRTDTLRSKPSLSSVAEMITVAGATANADSINSKTSTKDFLIDGLAGNDT